MRVYLDENLPASLVEPLSTVYIDHVFSSCVEERLQGTEDIPLLTELRSRGFDAIVTRDYRQLRDPLERQAVIESGLRWVGVSTTQLRGLEQITVTVASLIAGLRFVITHQPEEPTSYQLLNIPHGQTQRVKIRPLTLS